MPSPSFIPTSQVHSFTFSPAPVSRVRAHWDPAVSMSRSRAVAVGAFKVVIELEVKRRDNDKKVNLLFLEMKNMMSALLQYVAMAYSSA